MDSLSRRIGQGLVFTTISATFAVTLDPHLSYQGSTGPRSTVFTDGISPQRCSQKRSTTATPRRWAASFCHRALPRAWFFSPGAGRLCDLPSPQLWGGAMSRMEDTTLLGWRAELGSGSSHYRCHAESGHCSTPRAWPLPTVLWKDPQAAVGSLLRLPTPSLPTPSPPDGGWHTAYAPSNILNDGWIKQ